MEFLNNIFQMTNLFNNGLSLNHHGKKDLGNSKTNHLICKTVSPQEVKMLFFTEMVQVKLYVFLFAHLFLFKTQIN